MSSDDLSLRIVPNFKSGHSKDLPNPFCSPTLSGKEFFNVKTIEIWGVQNL